MLVDVYIYGTRKVVTIKKNGNINPTELYTMKSLDRQILGDTK